MPPPRPIYDSDSDDESVGSLVTDVQLGLNDGPLEPGDEKNPLVSRIGGRPSWLPLASPPPADVAICKVCGGLMELLAQIFAPLEESEYDRTLMVWGCARRGCQRKDGSVRAIRTLKRNERWAAKLSKKRKAKEEKEKARQEREDAARRAKADKEKMEAQGKSSNPFLSQTSTSQTNTGSDLGSFLFSGAAAAAPNNLFASSDAEPTAVGEHADREDSEESESEDEDEDEDVNEQLAEELAIKASLAEKDSSQDWAPHAPSYGPLYLSTVTESLSSREALSMSSLTAAQRKAARDAEAGVDIGGGDKAEKWGKEGYEKMFVEGVDEVFEKFAKRVGEHGGQCIRYEFGGEPLPYNANGSLYSLLFPDPSSSAPPPGTLTAVTGGAFAAGSAPSAPVSHQRKYDPSRVPPCEVCGSRRVFELQLMPHLAHSLSPRDDGSSSERGKNSASQTDDERRAELSRILGRTPADDQGSGGSRITEAAKDPKERSGIDWAIAVVFVCEKDCCVSSAAGAPSDETWREEWVGVQFED